MNQHKMDNKIEGNAADQQRDNDDGNIYAVVFGK
jgi:hypothetical protein